MPKRQRSSGHSDDSLEPQNSEFVPFGQHDEVAWSEGFNAGLRGVPFSRRPYWAGAASPALRRRSLSWEAGWVRGTEQRALFAPAPER